MEEQIFLLPHFYSTIRLMGVFYARLSAGWTYPDHKHDYFEFIYCQTGEIEQTVDNQIYILKPGDALFIRVDIPHSTIVTQDALYFNFHFDLEALEARSMFQIISYPLIPLQAQEDSKNNISQLSQRFLDDFDTYLQKLEHPSATNEQLGFIEGLSASIRNLQMHSRILELIGAIAEHCIPSKEMDVLPYISAQPTQIKIAYETTRLLEAELQNKIQIQTIAKKQNINRSYLSQSFKLVYGISPTQYFMRLKMKEAKRLLRETELTIEQISSQLAFYSINHFSQTFRNSVGLTPVQYRKQRQIHHRSLPNDL